MTAKLQTISQIEDAIARLRQAAKDPVSIRISENIDIELRPASESDERVLVGCKEYGVTVVNYAADGLILDVLQEGDGKVIWTGNFDRGDLSADE